MGNLKKAEAQILRVAAIQAKNEGGDNYSIGLTVGSGQEVGTQSVPTYNSSLLAIQWDHTNFNQGNSVKGSVSVNYNGYGDADMTGLKFKDATGVQLKGGIVIKQTNYPPRAVPKRFYPDLNHLNAVVSDSIFIKQLDLVDAGNGNWTLNLIFDQSGDNKYKLQAGGFKVHSFGIDAILELLLEPHPMGSNELIITGTVNSAQLSTGMVIIPTLTNYNHGQTYYKEGAVLVL